MAGQAPLVAWARWAELGPSRLEVRSSAPDPSAAQLLEVVDSLTEWRQVKVAALIQARPVLVAALIRARLALVAALILAQPALVQRLAVQTLAPIVLHLVAWVQA